MRTINPVIAMEYTTKDVYTVVEDAEGHHHGKQIDSYTIDDPEYIIMDGYDGESLATFDTYEQAKDYATGLKNHDKLDIDYDDTKEMYQIVKFNGYIGEWLDMHIYSESDKVLKEIIELIDKKED